MLAISFDVYPRASAFSMSISRSDGCSMRWWYVENFFLSPGQRYCSPLATAVMASTIWVKSVDLNIMALTSLSSMRLSSHISSCMVFTIMRAPGWASLILSISSKPSMSGMPMSIM